MIRIRRGTALMNKVLKQFDQAVANLEAAAAHIEAKRQKTIDKMDAKAERHEDRIARAHVRHALKQGKLQGQEYSLYLSGKKAQAVRDNIAKLVGAE